jgi:hypothetical protein
VGDDVGAVVGLDVGKFAGLAGNDPTAEGLVVGAAVGLEVGEKVGVEVGDESLGAEMNAEKF